MTGVVVWVTGLPSSGKTTLAARAQGRLPGSILLDSDEVRAAIAPGLGYAPEERDRFYAALARLAGLLARQGQTVLVAATAHRRAYRDDARAAAPRFVEVFVDVDREVCVQRDAKGLYARRPPDLPGAGVEYERPEAPQVRAAGGLDDEAVSRIVELVR
jgi:adenylylsulfate kinase